MRERVWVFHRGALGDSVLIWPMLRAKRERGAEVTLVTDGAKARLAARVLGVRGVDAEERRFTALWNADVRPEAVPGVAKVVSFMADGATDAGKVWTANVAAMFPGAAVESVPGPIDRVAALRLAGGAGQVVVRPNAGGPLVLHVGAGSEAKRWPLEQWAELQAALQRIGRVEVIAGEVEAERLNPSERAEFGAMGGRFVQGLDDLSALIGSARVFLGCDTGPTHLAAQLGVATVALFGPTDPERWGPIGPRVRVVGPAKAAPMGWLESERVLEAVAGMLTES